MDALHLLLALTILLIFFVWIVRFIGNYYGLSAHRPEESSLVVKKWEKDVVYLVKYADNNYCINASPFCLKLEFFLRYHKIVYKPIEAKFLALSSEGKKPFIEYNGRHYPDSDLIINFLVKEKKIKYNMTSEQKAISHLVQRLCDKSMYILNLYSKLEENMPMFAKLIKGNASTPEWHLLFMRPMIYYFLWNRVNSDGTGGHTKSEVVELLQQDLDAAERILGEKKFVAGEEASGGDFALFAHLMCAYYMPFTIPLRTIVDNRCPRLKAYMDRNHWNFFADYLLHDNEKVV